MQHTLSKTFIFEAAHSLKREIDAEGSRRIHGHTYSATVELQGLPDTVSGMVMDLGQVDLVLQQVRARLDHHFLDEVDGLGPATLENLCSFIWRALVPALPGLTCVTVGRGLSGDACRLVRGGGGPMPPVGALPAQPGASAPMESLHPHDAVAQASSHEALQDEP